MVRTLRRALGVAVLSLALGATTTACTGDSDDDPSAGSSSSAPPLLETDARLGTVAGKLPKAQAEQVVPEVAAVVDGWLDAAYVAGDYPREDFADAFPGFTQGAAVLAAKDAQLMTNADRGPRIDEVTARKRTVRVDVLGVKGKPTAATARVRLVFTTAGELEQEVVVSGRLRLTRAGGGWKVFAYDVAKGANP